MQDIDVYYVPKHIRFDIFHILGGVREKLEQLSKDQRKESYDGGKLKTIKRLKQKGNNVK